MITDDDRKFIQSHFQTTLDDLRERLTDARENSQDSAVETIVSNLTRMAEICDKLQFTELSLGIGYILNDVNSGIEEAPGEEPDEIDPFETPQGMFRTPLPDDCTE